MRPPAPSVFAAPGRHTSLYYAAFFMALGVHMPFWPLWLTDWGLSPAEVGFYTALGMAVRVVAGLVVPALADRLDARRGTVAVAAGAGIVLLLAHLLIETRPLLLAGTLAVGAVFAGIGPISEALGLAASRAHGFLYARARAAGSLGFLGANLGVGALIPVFGTHLALWWIAACLAGVLLLVPRHPGGRRVKGHIPPDLRQIGALLTDPVFALLVAAVAFTQAGHAILYAFGSLHWRALGLGEASIGALWAAAVAAEIVFMFAFGAAAIRWLGPVRALALSGAAGVLRWSAMTLDPIGFGLWPLQGLHAISFALGHLGAVAFIAEAVPPRLGAAAQGAMGSMAVGLVLAIGMALGAALYPVLGGGTYWVGTAFAAIGLGFALALGRRWSGQMLAG